MGTIRGGAREITIGITSRLASYVVNTSFSDIPPDVIERAKQMMLNAAGVGLAGSAEEAAQIITQYVQQMEAKPECTILGKSFRSSSANAALANGVLVNALRYDDVVVRRRNHPSAPVFPVVMALGEQMALPGREVVPAFAIGIEVSTKIGAIGDLEKNQPPMSYFWHLQGPAGTMGATAAAGKLLGLNQEQMENALGIAVSLASGVGVNRWVPTRSLHCGHAAMNGIMAGMLAQKRFAAARNAIEGAEGFLACFRRDVNVDADEFIRHLGNPYDVVHPGLGLKLYPCGSRMQTALEATLHLVKEHKIDPQEVLSVRVVLPLPHRTEPPTYPESGREAKADLRYCVAVALVHGQVGIHHFTDEAVKDPQVRAMGDRVTVEGMDRATTERITRDSRPSAVTITFANGQEASFRVEYPKGHPANPVTMQEVEGKFRDCSRGILEPDRIANVIAQFRRLEALPNVKPLFSALGGSGV